MSSLIDSLNNFDHGGFYMPSNDQLTFYCDIPKNASSWVSETLRNSNWIRSKVEDCFTHDRAWTERARQHKENIVIDNLIVVLRDPVERWIAGIAQYLSTSVLNSYWFDRSKFSEGYTGTYIEHKLNFTGPVLSGNEFVNNYNEVVERILFGQIAFDDHTQPQSWFVNYFKHYTKNYTWFYINKDFERFFLKHYNNCVTPSDTPDYNRGNNNPDVKIITEFLRDRIAKHPYLKSNLLRFYSADVELINNAEFVYYFPQDIDPFYPPTK